MSEITAGTWPGRVKSWDLVEVEKINQLKLVIWFNVAGSDWDKDIKFEGFFLKKDGTQNKKTYKTLSTCGFTSSDVSELVSDDSALDTNITLDLSIEKDDQGYWFVDWVNTPGGVSQGSIKDKTKLKGHNLSKLNSFLGPQKPKVKNYAPGADTIPPSIDTTEEIDEFLT